MSSRLLPFAAAIACLAMTGCSGDSGKPPTQPVIGAIALGGRVRLVSQLTGATVADSLGYRTIDDATGVRVKLRKPDGSTDSTLTVNGAFEFHVDDPGVYRVACWYFPAETLAAASVTVAARDTVFPDTLVLGFSRPLDTYPNPFSYPKGIATEFEVPSIQRVEFMVLDLAGVAVRHDAIDNFPPTLFHIHWVGVNDAMPQPQQVPNGPYWVAVKLGGRHHLDLVFKE